MCNGKKWTQYLVPLSTPKLRVHKLYDQHNISGSVFGRCWLSIWLLIGTCNLFVPWMRWGVLLRIMHWPIANTVRRSTTAPGIVWYYMWIWHWLILWTVNHSVLFQISRHCIDLHWQWKYVSMLSVDYTGAEHWAALSAGESHWKWKEFGLALLCPGLAASSAW